MKKFLVMMLAASFLMFGSVFAQGQKPDTNKTEKKTELKHKVVKKSVKKAPAKTKVKKGAVKKHKVTKESKVKKVEHEPKKGQ